MNIKRKAGWLFAAVSLFCVTGCYSEKDAPKKLTQSQADGVVLSIMAAQINTSQTNWIVTITARTNK
jgi:hypothetical protein